MQNRRIQLFLLSQIIERSIEDFFIASVFTPTVMVPINIGPVTAAYGKILPLDAGMQNKQNMVKNLPVREIGFFPNTHRQTRLDVLFELEARDFGRQIVVYFRCSLGYLLNNLLLFCFHKKRTQLGIVNLTIYT